MAQQYEGEASRANWEMPTALPNQSDEGWWSKSERSGVRNQRGPSRGSSRPLKGFLSYFKVKQEKSSKKKNLPKNPKGAKIIQQPMSQVSDEWQEWTISTLCEKLAM